MTIDELTADREFANRYGPWAIVAGASEGLGAAFARALAGLGLKLVLVARRPQLLEELAAALRERHHVEVRTLGVDLAAPEAARLIAETAEGLEVGLLVYNAAWSPIGRFVERSLDDQLRAVDVNVRTPTALAHHFGQAMARRGHGGLLLLSSLTAFQGSPFVATYGATKAYNLSLGEALWFELRESGVDVLAVCPGVTRTPGLLKASPQGGPGMIEPEQVVGEALAVLGRRPFLVPGSFNRVVSFVLRHLVPRRLTVSLMGNQTKKLLLPRTRT